MKTRDFQLFEGIADPTLLAELEKLPTRNIPKGFMIFDQGDVGAEVYAILSGQVEVVRRNPNGEVYQVAVLGPGELFGEFSYLTGQPRTTAALAMQNVAAVEMSAAWLNRLSGTAPEVRNRLIQLYRARILTNVLRTNKIFSLLEPNEVKTISSQMELRSAKDGEVILQQGNKDIDVIVIKRGTVLVSRKEGDQVRTLGRLGSGDLLGEMAVITGDPRSASAHSVGETEYMVLNGEAFKVALSTYPKLLTAVEDIVRSRSEQIRRAIANVVQAVVGDAWSDDEDTSGIQVESLSVYADVTSGEIRDQVKVLSVSRGFWTLESTAHLHSQPSGSQLSFTLTQTKISDLKPFIDQTPIHAVISHVSDGKVAVKIGSDDSIQSKISSIVTALARARVRFFVYPEYDVERLRFQAVVQNPEGVQNSHLLLTLSQTGCTVSSEEEWNEGEIRTLRISRDGKERLSIRAVCLSHNEKKSDLQFEYDTSVERGRLEEFIRETARELGFGQPSTATPAPARVASGSPILTRYFRTPQEFLKAYVGSIESGIVKTRTKEALDTGALVRVHMTIQAKSGPRRIAMTGKVDTWNEGVATIRLDELGASLREKIDLLCKTLVEENSNESWEKRRKELIESGVSIKSESRALWIRVAMATSMVLLLSLVILGIRKLSKPTDDMLADYAARERNRSSAFRDQELTITTNEGEVSIRASQVRSIKLGADPGELLMNAQSKTYSLQEEQIQNLSEFQKKHVERLLALQKK